ncbi:MAG: hypothetical protein J4A00_08990 [Gammaproteobacteria bacterium]|nr:hypothetical protein [Gammaproteobacteria bacterium]
MIHCPRCQSAETRIEQEGREGEQIIWSIYHCAACSFSWRDSEPEESISYARRDPYFRVDTSAPDQYRIVLPPE